MAETFITIKGFAITGITAQFILLYATYAVLSTIIDHVEWVYKKIKSYLPKKSVN